MWLLIDDCRPDLGCEVVARSYDAGIAALVQYSGNIECLCIDHDLGEEKTGYDVIVWAINHKALPPHVQIVSSNPVGRKNIAAALHEVGYNSKDGINYHN